MSTKKEACALGTSLVFGLGSGAVVADSCVGIPTY